MSDGTISVGFVCDPVAAEVQRYESLPIQSLWVGGHVASRNPTPEAMVQLARLAAVAERVRIGTSILLLPLYPPAIVAKQIADLDRGTGGRVTLGVGVGGEYPGEFRACEVPIEERGSRLNEAIPLLRELWSAEEVTHNGRHYSMDTVRIHPAPAQVNGPPIVVAGRQPVAMRRAATLGDGWMPYLYSPERYSKSVQQIQRDADAAQRDLTGFEWLAFVFVNVHPDSMQAAQEASEYLGGNYAQDFDAMIGRVAAVGDSDEVTAQLNAYIAAGARHLVLLAASRRDKWGVVERLAEQVVPRLAV